ncbi:MAG: N-glycosylase/DNA lyase [Candidatus Binatia bacterium]
MKDDPDANRARQEKLAAILAQIPWDAWEAIVRKEPEWQTMGDFLPTYGFGPLATLLVAAGLNDYHLKGKADIIYWPEIRRILNRSSVPASAPDLFQLLEQFYKQEREGRRKVETLAAFLFGPLAMRLWNDTPAAVAFDFLSIWRRLAQSLSRSPEEKQIVFAMKCLGLALLMAGETRFDFAPFPIPADSRLRKLTQRLKLAANGQGAMRNLWQTVLTEIQKNHRQASMIHLDSLLWQIAPLQEAELVSYFADLGIPDAGSSLQVFLRE